MSTPPVIHPLSRAPFAVLLALALLVAGGSVLSCSPKGDETPAPAGSAEPTSEGGSPDDVFARMGDETLTRAEVEEAAAEPLTQVERELRQHQVEARQKRHQVLEAQTRQLIRERLLKAEAEKRGVSQDELLQAEVQSRATAVTPEEVEAFYEKNKERIPAPKEQVMPQIERYLNQQHQSDAYEEFISGLEKAAQVSYEIGPYRLDIDVAGEPVKGPADAPVTIVEFSDFQCPFCGRVVPTLRQIEENYGDRIRLVYKQFPLRNLHPDAQKAAEASLCAHEQGKFWQMHDAMFADQGGLGVPGLEAKAGTLGLDTAKFSECLTSGRYADAVQEDLDQGTDAGVSGTPAMFINGRFLSGAVPYEQIAQVIDDELERRGAGS